MEFRPARVDDAAAISALICRFARDVTVNPDGAGAEQFFESVSEAAEAGYISDPRYHYIAAFAGSALAGFVAVRDRNHLFHLFVDSAFQRKGLAGRLWRAARAAACNTEGFTVNSTPLAIPVYERFGFVQAGPRVEVHGICFVPMRLPSTHEPG